MTMENVALEIIDEEVENIFFIDSDSKCEWALQKIAAEKAEMQGYIETCESMISKYKEKIIDRKEKYEKKTSFLKFQLEQYFNSVNHQKTKTQESYKLPSGTLKLKYSNQQFIRDDEKLVESLKQIGLNEYIKTVEKPDWSGLKDKIVVAEDKVLTPDGEIIEGIRVENKEPEFEVET